MNGAKITRWLVLLVTAGTALGYVVLYRRLPAEPASLPATDSVFTWPDALVPAAEDWAVFQPAGGPMPADLSPLARRFRLAGTFFSIVEEGQPETTSRLAILDDLEKKQQFLVREQESLDDVEIVRILQDHIVLASHGQQEELWLSFHGTGENRPPAVTPAAPYEEPTLEQNRFGRRVGETRWVLSRQALMEYYQELANDPERIAALYMTMKPDYREEKIAGYVVDIEGEQEFLDAVGLKQNDVIRKVNSMNMTSQRRAEYFLSEFLQERVSAVVLDVERGEQAQKLIYLIR
jgi:type II secretory pathway component PulC